MKWKMKMIMMKTKMTVAGKLRCRDVHAVDLVACQPNRNIVWVVRIGTTSVMIWEDKVSQAVLPSMNQTMECMALVTRGTEVQAVLHNMNPTSGHLVPVTRGTEAVLPNMDQITGHMALLPAASAEAIPVQALPAVVLPVCRAMKVAAWAVWAKDRKAVSAVVAAAAEAAKVTHRPVPVHNAAPVDEKVQVVPGNNLV